MRAAVLSPARHGVRSAHRTAPAPAPFWTSDDIAFMRGAAYVFAGLMFLRLTLSDPLLNQFYPYTDEGGNVAMKIHPATYGMLGLLFAMLSRLTFLQKPERPSSPKIRTVDVAAYHIVVAVRNAYLRHRVLKIIDMRNGRLHAVLHLLGQRYLLLAHAHQ